MELNSVFVIHRELISCHVVPMDDKDAQQQQQQGAAQRASGSKQKVKLRNYYIQLCLNVSSKSMTSSTQLATQGPTIRCQSEELARKLARIVSGQLLLIIVTGYLIGVSFCFN